MLRQKWNQDRCAFCISFSINGQKISNNCVKYFSDLMANGIPVNPRNSGPSLHAIAIVLHISIKRTLILQLNGYISSTSS